jgi:hypothetical protein
MGANPYSLESYIGSGGVAAQDYRAALQAEQAQRQANLAQTQTQTQGLQLQNQVQQQAIRDAAVLTSAYGRVKWDAPTADRDLVTELVRGGASGTAIQNAQAQRLKMRTDAAALAEKDALTGGQLLKNEQQINQMTGEALQPYNDVAADPQATDAQKVAAWEAALPQLVKLHPDRFAPGMAPPNQTQTAAYLGALGMHKAVLDEAEAKAKIADQQQKTALAKRQQDLEEAARANPDDATAQAAALTANQRLKPRTSSASLNARRSNPPMKRPFMRQKSGFVTGNSGSSRIRIGASRPFMSRPMAMAQIRRCAMWTRRHGSRRARLR